MARQLVEKYVDDESYQISQFATTESLKVLTRLSKILGPSFSVAMAGSKISDPKAQTELFGKAVSELTSRLDEEEVIALIKKLIDCCLRGEGKKINFELDFQGRLGHLFKLLKAVLEVQYGNFFQELGSIADSLQEPAPKEKSKRTATGGFGE